jgi:GT2 family glycosyltransferase
MSPSVSVVISVKNRAVLMWDCLVGLARQGIGRDRFEVVMVDNVSTDDLRAVAARAETELGLRIKYARMREDHGPAPARNHGVELATAPIIAFTDSDCRPDPDWLAHGLTAFDTPAVAFCTGPVLPKPEGVARTTSKTSFVTRAEHPTFPTANAFYRRDLFVAFGGFDTTLSYRDPLDRATECADTDLAWRLIEAGHARRFVPTAIMYHELEDQGLLLWILEPTRLFILPALVRRHPILREKLLTARYFFYPASWLLYLASAVTLIAVLAWTWLLLLLPILLIGQGMVRTRSADPRVLARFVGRVLLHMPRMLTMTLSLLYGSARFRCLVL